MAVARVVVALLLTLAKRADSSALASVVLLGPIPPAVGYQPTLATDMGSMQEQITTTKEGFITSVQVIYVPTFFYSSQKAILHDEWKCTK